MKDTREVELNVALQDLIADVAGYCGAAGAYDYSAEELGLEGEAPESRWYSAQVYGSNQGPSLDLIVGEDIGAEVNGEEWEVIREWNLSDELLDGVNGALEEEGAAGGSVWMDDNCLWWQAPVGEEVKQVVQVVSDVGVGMLTMTRTGGQVDCAACGGRVDLEASVKCAACEYRFCGGCARSHLVNGVCEDCL